MEKKLRRSYSNRRIAGVCAGLARYFNADPVIIRLIFVLLAIFGGSGFIIYLVMWIMLPSETEVI